MTKYQVFRQGINYTRGRSSEREETYSRALDSLNKMVNLYLEHGLAPISPEGNVEHVKVFRITNIELKINTDLRPDSDRIQFDQFVLKLDFIPE